MGLYYNQEQPLEISESEEHEEIILTGNCRTCKYHIELPLRQATPPMKRGFDGPSRMENDCYSAECPECGARAYLTPPDYHKVPKINEPLNLKRRE